MSEKFPKKDMELPNFKAEISKLKKEEEATGKTIHFEGVNPDELGEADHLIYQMFLDKILTVKELNIYRDELSRRGNQSQKQFAAYIGNKLFIQMYKKD